jgi:dephospho-CoA kinase
MKIIGLTGGIGSGKTTVLNYFKQFDIPVYVADIEAKRIMHETSEVVSKVKTLFGRDAYLNGKLNRRYIANIVFNDKTMLTLLNAIVHPAVYNDFLMFKANQKAPYLIYESALLFENHSEAKFDKVILVIAPMSLRIERIQKRDQSSVADIEARIKNQMSDQEKKEKSDYVILNMDLIETKEEVKRLHQTFSK